MDQHSNIQKPNLVDDQQQVVPPVEQVIVESLPLDKKLEIAKKINYSDKYEPGKYIDSMDTVNQWCLGEIVQVDQRVLNIHFDGWSTKWDCFYKANSFKVAPFRKHSKGYTGQLKIALRKIHFNLEDLHQEKQKVEKLIENDLHGLGAFETTQYLRGKLYIYVDFLLGSTMLNDEQIDAVNDFLYTILRLIITYLKKFPSLIPLFSQHKINNDLYMIDENIAILMSYYELLDILKKLFCCCHRCIKYYILHDKNVIQFDKPVAQCQENQGAQFEKLRKKDEEDFDIDEMKENINHRKNLVYGQFINFVNYFAEFGGFDAILDILRHGSDSDDNKIPLELVSLMTAPFRNCNLIFSETFTEHFVTTVKEIVFYRIRNMSEKEIKEIDKEVVSKVLNEIKDFLSLHYSEAETSELVESNQLFMAHRFLKSTYLEKRLKGLNHIKNMIDKIEAGQKPKNSIMGGIGYARANDQDQEMSGMGGNGIQGIKLKPPKWLTADYLKDWILNQHVLETVLGENTHLEIVKRSGCLLKFLGNLGALPVETVDLIWKCQLGKHEEMVRVIYSLIKDLVPFIQQEQIDQIFVKIQTVPHKQYDEKFINFLKDFTMKALENYYETKNHEMSINENQACDFDSFCDQREMIILQNFKEHLNSQTKGLIGNEKLYGLPIFWELVQDKSQVTNELMEQGILAITEILKSQYSKHIRMTYVIRSIENLIKGESITQSIIITQAIITEYPEFSYNNSTVTHVDFIQQLETSVQIVNILIQNILNYHQVVKERLKTSIDKKKQTTPTSTPQTLSLQQIQSSTSATTSALEDYSSYTFQGRSTHQFTINKLLEFLEFLIIASSNKVQFGINNIETMWRLFVQQPNCNQEQNMFLKWVNKQREVPYNKQELFLFSDEEKKFFFTKILCNPTYIDFRGISIGQVKCFHKYFKVINIQENLMSINRKTLKVRDFQGLIGMDTLWRISIESGNDRVKEESMDLLVDLHLKFEQVPIEAQKQIWEDFIQKCMKIIESCQQEGENGSVQSAINCVSKFIDRYDGKKNLKAEMKISPQFSNIQPMTVVVFNKSEQSRKQVSVSYFQTLGHLRQKIAEAFDYQMSEFIINIRNNYIDPDEDDDKYIKDLGQIQQVLIQKSANQNPENHPKNLISNNQAYFEKLFSILSDSQGSLIEPTWELLMKLPINAKLQLELKELTSVQKDGNWSQILDPKSTYKLLYSLKIINALSSNGKKDQKTLQWKDNFIKLGGFQHLLNTFLGLDLKRIETFLTLKCIELLIQILFEFYSTDKKTIIEFTKNKEGFILKCINLLDLISDFSIKQEVERGESFEEIQKRFQLNKMKKNKFKSYMAGNKGGDKKVQQSNNQMGAQNSNVNNGDDESEDNENQDSQQLQQLCKQFSEESQLVQLIFKFMHTCVTVTDPSSVNFIPLYKNIEEMLYKSMLKSENFLIRQEITKRMKDIIVARINTPDMKPLHKLIGIFLFTLEPQTQETKFESRCKQFYEGVSNLIEFLSHQELLKQGDEIRKLIIDLANQILNREIKEKNTQDSDDLLAGKMKLLKVLLQKFPDMKEITGQLMTQYLLHNCLFEIPNGGGQTKQLAIGQGGSPKCKSGELRKVCVRLLAVLCRDCLSNLTLVLKYLNTFNENPSWRTNKEHDWSISLRESEKSSTGYVGIKNLGCICYMNSLFQQLFMLPTLRNDILSVKNNNPNNEQKEENMLYQLQLLFTGLLKSEKQYVNPKGFCHAFKDWEGNATNVLEQMDVEEFFNMFMDRLETAIKGNPQDKTVQHHFGGKYTHEMICKGCPHTYERQEPFLALAVQVKNKKSILEGLETFIQGDMLEGENAYLCEKCDKKVDTLKRTSIKKLPRFLIVALKRFEFDFDRMIRVKVNDYCEFPVELNMEPYTQEGLARKEKAQKAAEKKEGEDEEDQQNASPNSHSQGETGEASNTMYSTNYPKDYYNYNLTGIVVHTGTADSGHYYSFIKDKDKPESGKWYEMNDSIVRDFDPNDIPSECYGGEDTFQGYNMVQMKSMKWRNAYLLFYERKIQDEVDEDEEEVKSQSQVPQQTQSNASTDVVMNPVISVESSEIDAKIAYENQKYWQNRFLFGNEYHELVYDISLNWNTQCIIPKQYLTKNDDFHILGVPKPVEYMSDDTIPDPIDEPKDLAKHHPQDDILMMEFNVFKLAVGFYIGILQRAANRAVLPQTLNLIKSYINKNQQCAIWILEEFCNEALIEENLLQSPQKEMRKFITGILYCAMLKVYPMEKEKLNMYWVQPANPAGFSILANFILIFIKNLYDLKKYVSHNMQYFQVLARFSSLGTEAREFLLRSRIIGRLMDYFFDEVSPYKDEFRSMMDINPKLKEKPDIGLPTQLDRKQMSYFQEIMERRRQKSMADAIPKYKYLIEIISNCIRATQIGANRSPYQLDDLTFQIQPSERDIFIPESKFLKRIFSVAQRTRSINAICQGYCHFTWNDSEHWIELLKTILQGLGEFDYDDIKPYLMLTQYMLAKPTENVQNNPVEIILQNFVDCVKNNATYFKFMETIFDFIFKITSRYDHVRQWFYSHKQNWEWMIEWIKEYKLPPNPIAQNSSIKLFKKRANANYLQMQNQMYKNDQTRATAMYHYRLKRIMLLSSGESPDTSGEVDTELTDMQDHKFIPLELVDIYFKKHDRINCNQVEQVLDEMIYIKNVNSDGQTFQSWQACDTDKLLPRGAIQNQIRFKTVEAFVSQLEAKRVGGGASGGDNYMNQSDEEDDQSDDEDLNRNNP